MQNPKSKETVLFLDCRENPQFSWAEPSDQFRAISETQFLPKIAI
jgi:hypothetical protein